jgi:Histidine kinase-, DNA gyrase B-, and HSP90-like ATPase
MLGNLLDNACKWARARVRLTCSKEGERIVIAIDDDGPGIEPSMREAVLRRGVRADEAAQGSGLGLAIVRDLAEIYGGSISLEESPMGGARATRTADSGRGLNQNESARTSCSLPTTSRSPMKLGMPPEKETLTERLNGVVMKLMSGQMVNDARQLAISSFRRATLEKDQLHNDAFRGVGFTWVLGLRKEPGHALITEFAQPSSDGRVTKIERLRLFRRSADSGQTRGNGVIALLDFAGDGDSVKRKGELCRHPLTSG